MAQHIISGAIGGAIHGTCGATGVVIGSAISGDSISGGELGVWGMFSGAIGGAISAGGAFGGAIGGVVGGAIGVGIAGIASVARTIVVVNTSKYVVDYKKLLNVIMTSNDKYVQQREELQKYLKSRIRNIATDFTQNVDGKFMTYAEFKEFIDNNYFVLLYLERCVEQQKKKCDLSYVEDKYIIDMTKKDEWKYFPILAKYVGSYLYVDRKTLNDIIDKEQSCKHVIINRCIYGDIQKLIITQMELWFKSYVECKMMLDMADLRK